MFSIFLRYLFLCANAAVSYISRYRHDRVGCNFAESPQKYPKDIELAGFGSKLVSKQFNRFIAAAFNL
jgi:hypothetical protein